MRAPTRFVCLLLALLLPLWGPGCGDDQSPVVAASLTIESGNAQSGQVGTTLSAPLTVRVTDEEGVPVGGATVTFSVTSGGGSVSPSQAETATGGTTATAWTLGTSAGEQSVQATVSGGGSVTFTATAVPGPAARVAVTPEEVAFDGVGQSQELSVTVEDEHGNAISSPEVSYASSDEAVVTVDEEGVLTSRGEGAAEVTVSSGSASATVAVTVEVASFEPEGDVTISGTVEAGEMVVGEGVTVTASGPTTLVISGSASVAGTISGDCQPITIQGGSVSITGTVANGCPGSPEMGADLTITSSGALDLDGAELVSDGDITISNDAGDAAAALRAAGFEPLAQVPALTHGEGHDCRLSGVNIRPNEFITQTLDLGNPLNAPDIRIHCGGHLAVVTPTIHTGWGGSPLGQPFDGEGDYTSGTGFDGGAGGDLTITANTLDLYGGEYYLGGGGDGADWYANDVNAEAIGGNGGPPGALSMNANISATMTLPPQIIFVHPGGDGGDGMAVGPPGSDVTARGGVGASLGEEGAPLVFFDGDFDLPDQPFLAGGNAGHGGGGHVIPGDGVPGSYQDLQGGDAGAGNAFSGDGGSVFVDNSIVSIFDPDGLKPGDSGGLTFEGAAGGMGGGSCHPARPEDRSGLGGQGGMAGGARGTPGTGPRGDGDHGPIVFRGFGLGGQGGRANDPGDGGQPGSHSFGDADPAPVFEDQNFLPGGQGPDCFIFGPATLTVVSDPAGHEPFTRYTSVTDLSWQIIPPGIPDAPPSVFIEGDGPWVNISGLLDYRSLTPDLPPFPITETGFIGDGRGTVAGFPNVRVLVPTATLRIDPNTLVPTGWSGRVEVGADGGLPTGQAEILDADASGSLPDGAPRALAPPLEDAGIRFPWEGETRRATRVPLRPEGGVEDDGDLRRAWPWSAQ